MGDLHSIACSSLGWDLHNLGVFNADNSILSHYTESTPPFSFPLDSDQYFSTGYLQDALFEFGDRSKRRRLMLFADSKFNETYEPAKSYWDSSQTENCSENFSYLSQITSFNGISGEALYGSVSRMGEDASVFTEMIKRAEDQEEEDDEEEEEISVASDQVLHSSASSSQHNKYSVKTSSSTSISIPPKQKTLSSSDPISSSAGDGGEKKRKKVAYPFAVVKPGGCDGDVTLNDINNRILMPPTRPVRHPVGDYACRPLVSPEGPGLSGKAVVAFTRIHTQGRGTITIIRTRG